MAGNVALPFFGSDPLPWQRPSGSTFSTWLNRTPPGLSTASLTDGTGGKPLVIQSVEDAASYFPTSVLKTAPSAPWIIQVAVAGITNCGSLGVWFYPIVLYNSIGDKALSVLWGSTSSPQVIAAVQVAHFATASVGQAGSPQVANTSQNGFSFADYFAWFRVQNDGTNLTFSFSPDGMNFFSVKDGVSGLAYTETVAGFLGSIDKVGFGIERLNNPGITFNPDVAIALWNWKES